MADSDNSAPTFNQEEINAMQWNLDDLYKSNKEAEDAVQKAHNLSEKFREDYLNKVANLNNLKLLEAIQQMENISEMIHSFSAYAFLVYIVDTLNKDKVEFYTKVTEACSEISSLTSFFLIEVNNIDDKRFAEILKDEGKLAKYIPYLKNSRRFKPYQLSREVEEILIKKSITSNTGWVDLFTKLMCSMEFEYDAGKKIGMTEIMNLLTSDDEKVREKSSKVVGNTLKEHTEVLSTVMNNIVKDKSIEDKERKFPTPISSMNLVNNVEDEIINSLLDVVQKGYKDTSHRYYEIKSKLMNKPKLKYWDRNAPLPNEYRAFNKIYTYKEAQELTLRAYSSFSKEMASIGEKFFQNPWIDVPPKHGKDSGAFAHPTSDKVHPYLMLNFMGKTRDVMTLAHELGHGVHQWLARGQGALMAGTPLTIAETASVFAEELVFQEILEGQTKKEEKIVTLCSKIEDSINTVIRQIAFCTFEQRVHDERNKSALSSEKLCDIWMAVQKESLGAYVELGDEYRYYWSYIPHFIHTPFYVYSYAFGNCLVNGLYKTYKEQSVPDFSTKYLELLSAGGSKHHSDLLAPLNINLANRQFWQDGLDVLIGHINTLESLI